LPHFTIPCDIPCLKHQVGVCNILRVMVNQPIFFGRHCKLSTNKGMFHCFNSSTFTTVL
jgi:hypothetical protein